MSYRQARLRRLNPHQTNAAGDYVLYWTQSSRRLTHNHALDYALRCAEELGRPLVVYEGLRLDYPWASRRLHRFVLEGMRDNAREAQRLGLQLLAVRGDARATRARPGRAPRGARVPRRHRRLPLLRRARAERGAGPARGRTRLRGGLERRGAAVAPAACGVRRGAPASAHPQGVRGGVGAPRVGRARAAPRPREAASIRPSSRGGRTTSTGSWTRCRWTRRSRRSRDRGRLGRRRARGWRSSSPTRLRGYAESRSQARRRPRTDTRAASARTCTSATCRSRRSRRPCWAPDWTPDELRIHHRGKREGYFSDDPDVNGFLDEALTWRDVGFQWHWTRRRDTERLETALPPWAQATLRAHAGDPRAFVYSRDEWEAARDARPALERGPAGAGGDRHHPQLPADAVGQEGDRVVALARGGVRDARAPQQQVRARRPRPELVHRHPLVLRPVRPAVGARAEGARHASATCRPRTPRRSSGCSRTWTTWRPSTGERRLSRPRLPRTRLRAAGRGRRGRARRPRGARPTPRGSRRRPTSRRTRARARPAR